MNDFAGTGYLSREYVVASKKIYNVKTSLGIGWGKFVGEERLKNPLGDLNGKFFFRPGSNNAYGGTPTYNQWFRGDISLFGGIEYKIPNSNGLKLKVEYDPFDYFDFTANYRSDASYELRSKSSEINYGISYPVNKYLTIDASYIKGNTFNLNFTYAITFNDKHSSKPKFEPKISRKNDNKSKDLKKIFYEELLFNLNNNNLLLQTASLDNKKLDVSISTSDHRNAIRSSSYASYIIKEVADLNEIKLNQINIYHINAGIELNKISYIANHIDNDSQTPIEVIQLQTELDSGNVNSYVNHEFKPTVKFPVIFSKTSPILVSHIGNPEKFYFGGVDLQNTSEIQFKRNLLLSSALNYRLYSNIRDTISGAASNMVHVRTDLVQYLKEDDLYITRLQLDYIMALRKNLYAKISGGIFERMYGGVGGEILYKPYNRNFSIDMNLFYVKQRTFDQLFKFQEYNTTTGHINFSYLLPLNIETNLSFGRYLAKDDGYTLDLSKRSKSGFKAGIYFTRTNVSKELFGEGSFDKGFYFQIPMDIFSKNYTGNYSSFKLSPLTRDGGAKLIYEKDLRGLINNSSFNELNSQWNGFLD